MTDTEMWAFGRRIEAAREGLRLSKRRAAARAGISETRWRQLEAGFNSDPDSDSGRRPVVTTPQTLLKMIEAVEGDANELLPLAGFDPDDPVVEAAFTQGRAKEETVDVSDLAPDERAKVAEFAEFLRSKQQ
ncbi:helix-turn-helix domain-containing protein [Nocardia salmonicida]|uniref:helix-turn-helix domain-containing protein n=1 Tax=Nocardia salmonicida TaxID=53431 RepID=UPI00363FF812